MKPKIKKIKGGIFNDKKGSIRFANDFRMNKYKRFYVINLPKEKMIRAFHGHMKERKAIFPISGSLLVCLVKLDNPNNPSKVKKIEKIILDAKSPYLIDVPPKYANGIMSLEKNTNVIFFSNKNLTQSENDDYRFSLDYWGKKVWEID